MSHTGGSDGMVRVLALCANKTISWGAIRSDGILVDGLTLAFTNGEALEVTIDEEVRGLVLKYGSTRSSSEAQA